MKAQTGGRRAIMMRDTGAQGRKAGSDNEAKPDVGEGRDVNRNMERG